MDNKLNVAHACFEIETPIPVAKALDEFLNLALPPRENLLNPWLPKSGICMVYAKRGVGKTFFALEVAMAVAYGVEFLSFVATKPAKVMWSTNLIHTS